jgi:hypothetical protein
MKHTSQFDIGGQPGSAASEDGPYMRGTGPGFPVMEIQPFGGGIALSFSHSTPIAPFNRAAAWRIVDDLKQLLGDRTDADIEETKRFAVVEEYRHPIE